MPRRAGWVLAAIAATFAIAGCGESSSEDDDPAEMPADFELRYEHFDGAVAPPHHREWTIEVGADGEGTFVFVPDYGGEGVPTYEESFSVPEAEVAELYAQLEEANLLEGDIEEPADEPIGGSIDRADIIADGETFEIPPFNESGASPLESHTDRIESLVPERVWREFEARADAYARSADSQY